MEQTPACPICGILLHAPFIKCAECVNPPRSFCLQCFSKGKELDDHRNDHAYTVVKNNFSLFDSKWTASEELQLLDSIEARGIGNWAEISRDLGTKTKIECEDHYFHYYVTNPAPPLPDIKTPESGVDVKEATPSASTTFSQDPPRPIPGTALHSEMAGYMPARGDFSAEFHDYAEMDIRDIEFDDEEDPLVTRLKETVLDIHLEDLQERIEKKTLIETYGLLSDKHNQDDSKRYGILGKEILETMKPFMNILEPIEYYKFMEGCLLEAQIKQRINLLEASRMAGITDLESVEKYGKLQRQRADRIRGKSLTLETLGVIKDEGNFVRHLLKKQVLKDTTIDPNSVRRSAPPLNIATLPEFEKLNAKERELCSNLRIMPSSYFQYKTTLLNEQRKLGTLRLANARSVIKIDVNKTRKIFDLLVEEGVITKT